jgi:[glutamine synthetase] adenylyltransferase / [glutamine synthetase]-adenylyl-L-tyrosine phosphorylase
MPIPSDISECIGALPAALRPATVRWFERLGDEHRVPDGMEAMHLVRTVAVSDFAAAVLLREWKWLLETPSAWMRAYDPAALARGVEVLAAEGADTDKVRQELRRERQRQLLGILWRELSGAADVEASLHALTDVAEQLLAAALNHATHGMAERFGVVRGRDGAPVPMLIIGMGKLGGRELNFSSDIDIIFAYPEDGESDGPRSLPAQAWYDRLSRSIVSLLDDVTADGFVYRTDTRLRPFGESGPPVVRFAALESYLLQHGRAWERYAYVKARSVGPPVPDSVHASLFHELIRPFVYRGYLDFGVFEVLRDLHGRIAAEGKRRELGGNIKLGPGGIREIEFIVQSLQLVRGGNRPELQNPSLLDVLPRLADERGLGTEAVSELGACYRFLRRTENFLQAMRDQQTHDLPEDPVDRERLRFAMGYPDAESFDAALGEVRGVVQRHFDALAIRDAGGGAELPLSADLGQPWRLNAEAGEWQELLEKEGFPEAGAIAARLVSFRNSSGVVKADSQSASRLRLTIPILLGIARKCGNPARAFERAISVIESILRRSAYLALLNENPGAAERFVKLCAQSGYIARELARFPVLLDELLVPDPLAGPLRREQLAQELRARLAERPDADSEEQVELLAQFQRATMFRIAVADCSNALQLMQVSDSLTWLAETVLEAALEIAWRELLGRYGRPCCTVGGVRREAGFGIIGYGKLGGLELSYGSDLDIVFLHDSEGTNQETDGPAPVDNAMFFARLVRRLIHFMSTRTNTGALYEIDTRLRPSGRKGLLVTSTESFLRYQEENAWTWEHQALLRARPVAGSDSVSRRFLDIRRDTLSRRVRRDSLREDVLDMRRRMRRELDDSNEQVFNLKHGEGGIGDIEFLVQYLVLENAATYPDVIEFTDNIRQLNALADVGALPLAVAADLQKTYRGYRRRQHRLALDDEPATVPVAEFAREREAVTRCWQSVFGA